MENIRHDNLAQAITRILIRQQWSAKEREKRAKMGSEMASKLVSLIGSSNAHCQST